MTLLSRRARVAARTARRGIRTYGRAKWAQGRYTAPRHPRRRPYFLAGLGAGALAAFFMDPSEGKRRRQMVRDRGLAPLRRGKQEPAQTADDASGHARGAVHPVTPDVAQRETATPAPMNQ
jgi:hypothetical protein